MKIQWTSNKTAKFVIVSVNFKNQRFLNDLFICFRSKRKRQTPDKRANVRTQIWANQWTGIR